MYLCGYVCACLYVCACMRVHMYVRVFMNVYVHMYVCARIFVYLCVRMPLCRFVNIKNNHTLSLASMKRIKVQGSRITEQLCNIKSPPTFSAI